MNRRRTCRICLAVGVRMTNLGDHEEKCFIENIFKSKGFYQDLDVRHYACYECKALLHKSYSFIQKSLRAQMAMYDILKKSNVINLAALQNIDRYEFGLISTLGYHRVDVDYCFEEEDVKNTLEEEVEITIKQLEEDTDTDTDTKLLKFEDDLINILKDDEDEYYLPAVVKMEVVKLSGPDPLTINHTYASKPSKGKEKNEIKDEDNNVTSYISMDNIVIGRRKRKVKYLAKDSDFESDSSAADKKIKRKKIKRRRRSDDEDYDPKAMSVHDSDSEFDNFDESGRRIKRPDDNRKYPMKCDHCDYEIEEKRVHYRHYLYCHQNIEYPYQQIPTHVCQFCGIKKRTEHNLREHELTHGDKEVKCPNCELNFHNHKQLQSHKGRVHTGKLLYCDHCMKPFKVRSDLVLHIRTHTGEKPFKCHICEAAFAHRGNVGVHVRNVHQKEHVNQKKKRNNNNCPVIKQCEDIKEDIKE